MCKVSVLHQRNHTQPKSHVITYLCNNGEIVIDSKAFNNNKSAVYSHRDKYPGQCQKESRNPTDLETAVISHDCFLGIQV
jgi:hypothetical protein